MLHNRMVSNVETRGSSPLPTNAKHFDETKGWRPGTITPSPTSSQNVSSDDEHSSHHDGYRFFVKDTASPGAWYTIHLLAADGKRQAVVDILETFMRRFTCAKCSVHIEMYLARNKIPEMQDDYNKKLFEWSVNFHNEVSKRIGKPTLTSENIDVLFRELTTVADDENLLYRLKLSESSGSVRSEKDHADCVGCSSSSNPPTLAKTKRQDVSSEYSFVP